VEGGTENAKQRHVSKKMHWVTMVEASYANTNIGLAKGQQQTPESCCSTHKTDEKSSSTECDEALTFTVINSKNTKLFQTIDE